MITQTDTTGRWVCTGYGVGRDAGCNKADGSVIQITLDDSTNHYFCPDCLAKAIQSDRRNELFGAAGHTACDNCQADLDTVAFCNSCARHDNCGELGTYCSCENNECEEDHCEACDCQHSCASCGSYSTLYCSATCAWQEGEANCEGCDKQLTLVCSNADCSEHKDTTEAQPQQVAAASIVVDANPAVDGIEFRFG